MTLIKSMEDLANAKKQAAKRQKTNAEKHPFLIRIGLSSCGIAAGASDTLEAINGLISSGNLPGVNAEEIQVVQTGCIGLCALEPIVQVQARGHSQVTYGKVTPEVAKRILAEHVGKGHIVRQYEVDII